MMAHPEKEPPESPSCESLEVRDREVLIVGELTADIVALIEASEYGAEPS